MQLQAGLAVTPDGQVGTRAHPSRDAGPPQPNLHYNPARSIKLHKHKHTHTHNHTITQTTPHRVAVRVEKGVDVALALAMTQPRPPATAPHHLLGGDYELVVVVTEDGDLEAAFKASAAMRRTFVCGLRDGIAPALRRWVRSEGDRCVYVCVWP